MRRLQARALAFATFALTVDAHGGLTFPPPRNNFHNIDPTNVAHQPGSTHLGNEGGNCAGDECLWYNEGCWNGCPNCSSTVPKEGNYYGKPNCMGGKLMEPTLPEQFRTWNIGNPSAKGDWTKYHPWRAPGYAPVVDPCGMAGGYINPGNNGKRPNGAKGWTRGSELPKLGVKTEWTAGNVVEVGSMIGTNHGGGYVYSICPASEPLTEKCFQKTTLAFVGEQHTIRYLDNGTEFTIPAMDINKGTWPQDSTWRRDPFPACNCDGGDGCKLDHQGGLRSSYADEGKPEPYGFLCPTGTMFPVPFAYGYGDHIAQQSSTRPDPNKPISQQPARSMWAIVDQVRVPEVSGEFVLRWRWDCEQTPQVWSHCADVTIVPRTPPAPATPTA